MLQEALECDGPAVVRYPKGVARQAAPGQVGSGLAGRLVRGGGGELCILAVGHMLDAAEAAAAELAAEGVSATVWDVRVVRPPDPAMVADAARHRVVVTVEDGTRVGGAGAFLADAVGAAATAAGDRPPSVVVLGTPVAYLAQAKPAHIHAALGLDGPGVAAAARAAVAGAASPSR